MGDLTTWARNLYTRHAMALDDAEADRLPGLRIYEELRTPSSESLHTLQRSGEIDDAAFAFLSHFQPVRAGTRRRTLLLLRVDSEPLLDWYKPVLRSALRGVSHVAAMQHPDNVRWFRLRAGKLGTVGQPSLGERLRRFRGGSIVAIGDNELEQMRDAVQSGGIDLAATEMHALWAANTPHGRLLRCVSPTALFE